MARIGAAGQRDRRITLQRATVVQDAYGEEIATWADIGQAQARIFYGRGNERREAAAERSEMPITFSVLSNGMTRSLTARDRISYGGLIWDIEGIAPATRHEIEITAVAAP